MSVFPGNRSGHSSVGNEGDTIVAWCASPQMMEESLKRSEVSNLENIE